jgi:hypothetical protein
MAPSISIALRKAADFATAASPAAIALGIALAIAPTSVRAEARVHGTPQAVVVEAENATVGEILVALADTFEVRFRSAANLDKQLAGTYAGTLQQTVSQILKGYDFVVKSDQGGLEITLLGAGKPVAVVGARPATKSAEVAAIAPQLTATATEAGPMPVLNLGGPTPPISLAQGPAPVPTPPTAGASPGPVPQIGPGPTPVPPLPGAAPTAVPPLPTASSVAPPLPTGTPSTGPRPAPATAPAAGAPQVPSPAR